MYKTLILILGLGLGLQRYPFLAGGTEAKKDIAENPTEQIESSCFFYIFFGAREPHKYLAFV